MTRAIQEIAEEKIWKALRNGWLAFMRRSDTKAQLNMKNSNTKNVRNFSVHFFGAISFPSVYVFSA